jgi:hypothetical protein
MTAPLTVGDRVRLKSEPPYIKTADTMPMLRPGDLVPVGEEGLVIQQKAAGYWTIKFDQGSFLVDTPYLEKVTEATADPATGTDGSEEGNA